MDRLESKYEAADLNLMVRVTPGGPRLPEELVDVNQGRIADLLPGEWGLGMQHSVLRTYDRETERGTFFVDTNDPVLTARVLRNDFESRPAILRVSMDDTPRSFVADMRHVGHYLYRFQHNVAPEYGPLEEASWFQERVRLYGSQVLKAVIFRQSHRDSALLITDTDPNEEFVNEVKMFCEEVDKHYEMAKLAPSIALPVEAHANRYYETLSVRQRQGESESGS